MILYFILFFTLVIGIFINLDKTVSVKIKTGSYCCFAIFIMILAAFRDSSIGNDTIKYLYLFESIKSAPLDMYLNRFEPGYILLNKLLGQLSDEPQSVIIVTSVIIWGYVCRFLSKYSLNPFLSTYFIICFGFFSFFFSGIRESLAIAICLYGTKYIFEKNLIKFLFTVLVATCFHFSAVVFILAYALKNIKLNQKSKIIILSISILLMTEINSVLSVVTEFIPRFSSYLSSVYFDGNVRLASILNLVVILLVYSISSWYFSNDINEVIKNKNGFDCKWGLDILYIGIMILMVSFRFNLLDRFASYFTIFISVIIPNIFLSKVNNNKITYLLSMMVCFGIYFIVIQIYRPEWNNLYPYYFFWER